MVKFLILLVQQQLFRRLSSFLHGSTIILSKLRVKSKSLWSTSGLMKPCPNYQLSYPVLIAFLFFQGKWHYQWTFNWHQSLFWVWLPWLWQHISPQWTWLHLVHLRNHVIFSEINLIMLLVNIYLSNNFPLNGGWSFEKI